MKFNKLFALTLIIMVLSAMLPAVYFVGKAEAQQIQYPQTGVETQAVTQLPKQNWTAFWPAFNKVSDWDLQYYNGTAWVSKKSLLQVIKTFKNESAVKIALNFTSSLAGSYRLLFAINTIVKSYVDRTSNYFFNLTYEGYSIGFDWSDLKSISGLQINKGITDNYFWFAIRRDSVPANYNVILDPTVVAYTKSYTTSYYSYQRKMFFANGRHFVFFSNDTTFYGESDPRSIHYLYYTTSIDGLVWINPIQLGTLGSGWDVYGNIGAYGHGFQFSIWFDGTYVHVVKRDTDWDTDPPLYSEEGEISYRRGTPNSDGSITWSTPWQIVLAHAMVTLFVPTIAVDKDGYPWIGGVWRYYTIVPPYSWIRVIWKCGQNDGTWTSHTTWNLGSGTGSPPTDPGGQVSYSVAPIPSNSSANVLVIYTTRLATIKAKLYTGSMGSEMTVSTGNIQECWQFGAVGLDDKYMVGYTKQTNYYMMADYYNGASWAETTVQSSFDTPDVSMTPALFFNYTKSPAQVVMLWVDRNATDDYARYKKWTALSGWDSSYSVFCTDGYPVWFHTINVFYTTYDGIVGLYFIDVRSSLYLVYSYMTWSIPPTPEVPPFFYDFYIDNMDADNWLFAEYKYYNFIANLSEMEYYGIPLIELCIYFVDGAERPIMITQNITSLRATVDEGEDLINVAYRDITIATYTNCSLISVEVILRTAIIDKMDVDFYLCATNNATETTGWILVSEDYCNIYSRGGASTDIFTGDAARTTAGDVFEFESAYDGFAYSEAYFRYLQHVKLMLTLHVGTLSDALYLEFGLGFYANGRWNHTYILGMRLWGVASSGTGMFANWTVSIYEMRVNATYAYPKFISSSPFFTFYDGAIDDSTFYVDMWFNRINASSIVGLRVSSYEFPVKDNADPWWQWWTGSNYGKMQEKNTVVAKFVTMYEWGNCTNVISGSQPPDRRLYSKEIELTYIYASLTNLNNNDVAIKQNNVFDITITAQNLEGIQTPPIIDPKMPAVPQGGGLSGLIFGGLSAVWSFVSSGINTAVTQAITPVLSFFWTQVSSAIVTGFDAILAPVFGPSAFSNFCSFVSQSIVWLGTASAAFVANIASFLTSITSMLSWFFTNLFTSLWGIIEFIFMNAAFSIFTTLGTILGVSYAWLGGTTYTNGWGQVYDFSYLSQMGFAGFHGGIVVFLVLFVVGFFITILACVSRMSLEPIAMPIRIGFRLFLGLLQIFRFFWSIIEGVYNFLARIIDFFVPT